MILHSVQCCTCSKWIHLSCSQVSFSKFRTLGKYYFWIPYPCCVPTRNTVTSSSDSSNLYTSIVQSGHPSANATLPPHPRLQTSYPCSAHFVSFSSVPSPPPLASGCHFTPLSSAFPLTPSCFFNGMLEVFESEALNCYTFFRPIRLTLSVSRNPILTHLGLSVFLVSLLCVLIAPSPDLALSLIMSLTLAVASSFSSGRAYPSLNFLPLFFLHLIPTLMM